MTSLLFHRLLFFCASFYSFHYQCHDGGSGPHAVLVSAFAQQQYRRDRSFVAWSSPFPSPGIRPQRPPSTQPCTPLYGSSSSDNDAGHHRRASKNLRTPRKELRWNLPVLLSSADPARTASLSALMDVYNAAVARLPRAPESRTVLGRLPPTVAPYRRFVRKYDRDMGHDGRFTVFCDPCDHDDYGMCELGSSLQADVVFGREDPLQYIRDALSYRASPRTHVGSTNDRYRYDTGTKGADGTNNNNNGNHRDETVVFVPGLHTFHEEQCVIRTHNKNTQHGHNVDRPSPPIHQRTTTERVQYYSQVLDDLPMAQLHQGTYADQGDIDLELTQDTVMALKSFQLLQRNSNHKSNTIKSSEDDASSDNNNNNNTGEDSDDDDSFSINSATGTISCRLRAEDLDIIRTVLSKSDTAPFHMPQRNVENNDNARLKRTLIKLIDTAVRSKKEDSPHLVLITYSASSIILAAALAEWKEEAMNPSTDMDSWDFDDEEEEEEDDDILSEQEVELFLRERLTVVTVGALCQDLIDGPAYIHVSMHDDALSTTLGVSKRRPEGGGSDAVYLHGISPYLSSTSSPGTTDDTHTTIYGNDAHSMDACAVQYLSLVRRINGVTSFRTLYDLANDDGITLDLKPSLFSFSYRTIGQLEMPPHLEGELLPSMIRATGGERWLQNADFQLGEDGVDGFDSPLPSLYDSEAYLTQQFGYSTFDVIRDSCFGGECYNF